MRTFLSRHLADVGHGLAFPLGFSYSQTTEGESPLKLEVEVRLTIGSGRYVLHAASMAATDLDQEINGTLVRSIQFNEIMNIALDGLHYFDIDKNQVSNVPALSYVPENREQIIADGPTPESLAEVAKIYRIATVMRAKQAVHVQKVMQMPYPTAANWITRARKLELIEARDSPSIKIEPFKLPQEMDNVDFVGLRAES